MWALCRALSFQWSLILSVPRAFWLLAKSVAFSQNTFEYIK